MTGIDILVWVLFGLIAGMLAQFLMPGKDPGESSDIKGFVITTVLGIAGAFVGGYIGHALGLTEIPSREAGTVFNWRSLAAAVCGALIVLLAYRAVRMLILGLPATAG